MFFMAKYFQSGSVETVARCAFALRYTSGWRKGVRSVSLKKANAAPSWDHIYKFVKHVPRGNVITYGDVARRLHLRGGARVAGYAMAACPNGHGIPWHRVVGAGGRIRLREPLAALQRKLLQTEGVQFIETRVDIARHLWKDAKRRAKHKAPSSRPSRRV